MSNKSRGGLSAGASESLCCCEYTNMDGTKSHLLALCCDCEALDETFDKIFKCERVSESTLDRLLNTVADRCRLPTCFGQGAVKLRPDVITPVIVVPLTLVLATVHPVMTVLCFLSMPLLILMFHAIWRRKDKHRRSLFFYSWGLSSVVSAYLVFQFCVVAFREVLLWEILTVVTLMMIMFYFLYLTKHDPDLLIIPTQTRRTHKRTPSNPLVIASASDYDQNMQQTLQNGEMASLSSDPSLSKIWPESRKSGGNTDVPARAGYCKICQDYIAVRDHHCVWIDSCVGAANHRSFLLAMLMFILTGVYSVHLTLTTVCTPKMYLDWFLLPNDCRWLYHDFLTAICFVTAIYCAIVVSLVCLGLMYQVVLISQNLTSHELAQAHRQGLATCGLFVRNHPHNKGFLRNWLEFWLLPSRATSNWATV